MSRNTLILIDVQREYIDIESQFYLSGIEPSLTNAKLLLDHARCQGWKIVHVQHLQDARAFIPGTPQAEFIAGFEPHENEWLITKSSLSAFTNPNFEHVLRDAPGELFVAGYGSPMCCTATMISGGVHGLKFTFVQDASWAKSSSGRSEGEMHQSACAVLAIHSAMTTASEIFTHGAKVAA